MIRSRQLLTRSLMVALPLACLLATTPTRGYVDLAPTLSKVFSQSRTITLVEVQAFDSATHTVTLKAVRGLKGDAPEGVIKQVLQVSPNVATPRPVAQWAAPGSRGVLFSGSTISLLCYGTGWYQVQMTGGSWKLDAKERPDLPLAFYGKVSRLSDCIEAMQAGNGSVISVVAFGADSEGASFDLALNRQSLPGIVRLQRIRASADMPQSVASASSNPAYFIGAGEVDERDVPELTEKLKSKDAAVRAEAAEDLRTMGRKARSAAPALAGLLNDAAPQTRFAAATALLRISAPADARAIEVMAQGLVSTDETVRRAAASAAGFSGAAGAPLAEKLALLLKDSDENVRVAALVSISMMGPAADKAVGAVIPLLDDPAMTIDAADALGRIGPAAQPALKRLTAMLSSDQLPVCWAAVRAMAQIGGEEAHPAVDFMVKKMPTANEVEGYNMMIYLSLLGPVAQDAGPAIQQFRIKNPVLPSATMWAIAPEKSLPWQGGGRGFGRGGPGGPGGGFGPGGGGFGQGGPGGGGPGGGFVQGGPGGNGGDMGGGQVGQGGPGGGGFGQGGPGGGGPGGGFGGGPGGRGGPGGFGGGGGPGGGGADIGTLIYQAYVHELGTRLRTMAPVLAKKIMDGTAGEVPSWGYKILAAGPDLSLAILTPHLTDGDQAMRERAAVALGYMGDAAAPAKAQVQAAASKAETEREAKLMQWCLRQINED